MGTHSTARVGTAFATALVAVFLTVIGGRSQPAPDAKDIFQMADPKQFLEAKTLMTHIQESTTLPAEAKKTVGEQFGKLQQARDQLVQPMIDVAQAVQAKDKELSREEEALGVKIDRHNTGKSTFTPEEIGAKMQYDAEARQLRAEAAEAQDKRKREMASLANQWEEKKKSLEGWLAGPSLKSFSKVAQDLLDHKLTFKHGTAWDQLVRAAEQGQAATRSGSDEAAITILHDPFDHPDPVVPPERRTERIDGWERARGEARAKRQELERNLETLRRLAPSSQREVDIANLKDQIGRRQHEELFYNYSINSQLSGPPVSQH